MTHYHIAEVGLSAISSYVITESIGVDNLLTALITFGISVITVVGGELIKYLVTFFKKKTEQLENKNPQKKGEE